MIEIEFYNEDESLAFAQSIISSNLPDDPYAEPRKRSLELILKGLRSQTQGDGDRFAGYAPVLAAVATRVSRETNPAALISSIESREQALTLREIVNAILERERSKLGTLKFEDESLSTEAYKAGEQIERLAARVYNAVPPSLPKMSPNDAATYSKALETWVSEHPFLNGAKAPSSAVFEAVIAASALTNANTRTAALASEIEKGAAANPFLSEFYPMVGDEGVKTLPPEHIGIVYSSLRAGLSLGDGASLTVEGEEDTEEGKSLTAHIEMMLHRRNSDRNQVIEFETLPEGPIVLGKYLEDVEIYAPNARVDIGPGDEAIFVAPVSIQCREINVQAERLIVETLQGDNATGAAFLQAESFEGPLLTNVPLLRGKASLAVSWPSSNMHPWTAFSTTPAEQEDPLVQEGLRRLRKFVVAFRSHSKGALKRYKDKLDHARMTKGAGKAVLEQLISEGVITLDGAMYTLDSQKLGSEVGTTYAEAMAFDFGADAIAFIKRAIQ